MVWSTKKGHDLSIDGGCAFSSRSRPTAGRGVIVPLFFKEKV